VSERQARRLERFARARGLIFEREPAVRRTPLEFRRYTTQRPIGWFGVPGPTGYEVAQRHEVQDLGDLEHAHTSRLTWVVFTLRTGPAGDAEALRVMAEMAPRCWHAQCTDGELIVWTRRFTRLTSPRLWKWLASAHDALTPLLSRSAQLDSAARRQRASIPRSVER